MKSPEQQANSGKEVESKENTQAKQSAIPPQYKGMPSEMVENIWQKPIYTDAEKNKAEAERRKAAIEEIKQAEQARETHKEEGLQQLYASLPDEQKKRFPNAQKDAVKMLNECIRSEREINDLSPEESFVVQKLKTGYESFKKDNPDKPFVFDFAKALDKKVYHNLAQRLAFRVLANERKTNDQAAANAIREKIGIPKQPVQGDNQTSPEQNQQQNPESAKGADFKEIFDAHKKIYFKKRMTLRDEAFEVAHGINPETGNRFELISGEIGMHFDAHGIAKSNQLEKLLQLLENGIDPTKSFYTAPFEIPDNIRAAMGAALGTSGGTAYKEGIAVVTSGYQEKLAKDGIKHVFINDVYGDLKAILATKFPQYKFHLLSEQKQVMEAEFSKNNPGQ